MASSWTTCHIDIHRCAAGDRRRVLDAFVAAFGVDAGRSAAASQEQADPMLQVSHAYAEAMALHTSEAARHLFGVF